MTAIRTNLTLTARPSHLGTWLWLLVAAGALGVMLCVAAISAGINPSGVVTAPIESPPSGLDHLSQWSRNQP